MTAVAGHVSTGRPAPVVPSADAPGSVQVPRLADRVELLGEYKGSGYRQPPSLVRQADGQVIQMTALLYQVTSRIGGARGSEAITHLEMLEQLLPFVRFDGYYILSDLVGVPDLFARVAPILKSVLPAGRRDPARGGPAARHPDRGARLGGLRHPAADVHLGVPSRCTCLGSTGRSGTPRACRRTS